MGYEDRIVCFLDLLGFKNEVACTAQKDVQDKLTRVERLEGLLVGLRQIVEGDKEKLFSGRVVTQFSDSIVFSFPAYAEGAVFNAIVNILKVQVYLIKNGYLCRGGVARGELVHTPEMLFGPAMLKAYELESKLAVYPRVIFDDEILNTGVVSRVGYDSSLSEQRKLLDLLGKDLDGMYYTNYVTGAEFLINDTDLDYPNYLCQLLKMIGKGFKSKDPSVEIKYSWIREKLVDHLYLQKKKAHELPENDEVRIAYARIGEL